MGGGFSPLDEELGLLPQVALTPSLGESAVRLGTWIPFGAAAEMLAHFVQTQVSESTLTRLTERAGAAYVAVQESQAARVARGERGPAEVGPPLQQVSVDGAMVPLVQQGWVEAKTLAIGTVQPPVVRADGTVEVHTADLSYFSRVADCHAFTEQATLEIVRRGTLSAGQVVGVVDGARWEQEFLDVQCPAAVRILDWPHGVGYLAQAARALYGVDTPASHAWLTAQREILLHGDPQVVLAKLRGLRDELALQAGAGPPPALAVLDETLAYLTSRLAQIQYAAFRAQGFPIGSGAVESANKLVVEARLQGAGMHWALVHVNPLLALRGMACSDRWAEAWPQLTHQWRTEARAQVLVHRRARQRARQAAADQPVVQPGAADAAVAPTPPGDPVLGAAAAPSPPDVSRPTGPLPPRHATPRRPSATHPWRRPFSHPRPHVRSQPGI